MSAPHKVERVDEIDLARVRHVALLARLDLTDDEVRRFSRDLTGILVHINKLAALDLTGVEPTSHALPLENVFRDDEPAPSLSNEEALANAPEKEDDCFRVPQII